MNGHGRIKKALPCWMKAWAMQRVKKQWIRINKMTKVAKRSSNYNIMMRRI